MTAEDIRPPEKHPLWGGPRSAHREYVRQEDPGLGAPLGHFKRLVNMTNDY